MKCSKCKGEFSKGEKLYFDEKLFCIACYRSLHRYDYTTEQNSNCKITREQYQTAIGNGIAPRTVRDRLQRGYSMDKAITYPTHKRKDEK